MLVLSRKIGFGVMLGSDVQITLNRSTSTQVTLWIKAPRNKSVRRSKLDPQTPSLETKISNLVLTLKVGESLIVDETTTLTILKKGGSIRFGINAPRDIRIRRTELDDLNVA